jgi:hypothetical protein
LHERIHRGFNRLALLAAGSIGGLGLLFIIIAAYDSGGRSETGAMIVVVIALAAIAYALVRGLGWAIAGFLADR